MARTCAMQCARHPTTTTDHSGGSIGWEGGRAVANPAARQPAIHGGVWLGTWQPARAGGSAAPGSLRSFRVAGPWPGRETLWRRVRSGRPSSAPPRLPAPLQVAPFGAFSSAPPTRASHWCRFPGLQWAPLHTQIQRYGPGAGTQAQLTKTAPMYYAHPDATPSTYKCLKMIEDQATWQILAK